jgi:peptide-methionine (S)-S-oxide reductase
MSIFSLFDKSQKLVMPDPSKALKGRPNPIPTAERHFVNGNRLKPPYPDGYEQAMFGMGCFWGAERKFWQNADIYITAVGYSAGFTPNPTYEEVCSGLTGHNEVVLAVYDPAKVSYAQLLKIFWENHNPTQGMRQGNDVGTQYRSGIYFFNEQQHELAEKSLHLFQDGLTKAGYGKITTEILPAQEFFFAEGYHQQYLAKNPNGYCGLGGCAVALPVMA